MLTEADKRVIKAFVDERAADSRLLDTDGRKLDKMGLGSETVAFWHGRRIAIVSTESAKSDESIIRAITKEAGPGIVDYSYARKGHRVHALGAPGRVPRDMETNGRGMKTNGRATITDPTAARELSLYIENEYSLIGAPNSIGKSIDSNLRRKLASGKYDPALAPKAWEHLIDAGAKKYENEFGSGSQIFNAATRRSVAVDFARAWELENGA